MASQQDWPQQALARDVCFPALRPMPCQTHQQRPLRRHRAVLTALAILVGLTGSIASLQDARAEIGDLTPSVSTDACTIAAGKSLPPDYAGPVCAIPAITYRHLLDAFGQTSSSDQPVAITERTDITQSKVWKTLQDSLFLNDAQLSQLLRDAAASKAPADKIAEMLLNSTANMISLYQSLLPFRGDDPEVAALRAQGLQGFKDGQWNQVATALQGLVPLMKTRSDQFPLVRTQLLALQAHLALVRQDFEGAKRLWKEGLVRASEDKLSFMSHIFQEQYAKTLYRQGVQNNAPAALDEAAREWKTMINRPSDRTKVPPETLQEARETESNNAFTLGEADYLLAVYNDDTTLARKALSAFQKALELDPDKLDKQPSLSQADIYNGRGASLLFLAEHGVGSTAHLDLAAASFRRALRGYPVDQFGTNPAISKLPHARTQINLARALIYTAQQAESVVLLQQAVTACQAALTIYSETETPDEWATAQVLLGDAYVALGDRRRDAAITRQALPVYRAAQEVYAPKTKSNPDGPDVFAVVNDHDRLWARIQARLGAAYLVLARQHLALSGSIDKDALQESVNAFTTAIPHLAAAQDDALSSAQQGLAQAKSLF